MKLRQQFKTEVSINTSGESGRFADKCVEIADNYVIEFDKWKSNLEYTFLDRFTISELLDIYKKEKGL